MKRYLLRLFLCLTAIILFSRKYYIDSLNNENIKNTFSQVLKESFPLSYLPHSEYIQEVIDSNWIWSVSEEYFYKHPYHYFNRYYTYYNDNISVKRMEKPISDVSSSINGNIENILFYNQSLNIKDIIQLLGSLNLKIKV